MATDCYYCAANFTCVKDEGFARAQELFPLNPIKEESPDLFDEFYFEELETFYEDIENAGTP